MKVLVLGATGMIGSAVVDELDRRGHEVIRALRPVAQGRSGGFGDAGFVEVDPLDAVSVAAAAAGADAVVSALGGGRRGNPDLVADVAPVLLAGLEAAGVGRLLVVGGAGSLSDGPHRRVDAPDFPAPWRAGSLAQARSLDIYRAYAGLVEWSYLSPSDHIDPGATTGQVELGTDELLRGPDGESWVSTGDYASTLVDELESSQRTRRRFTVRTLVEPGANGEDA